MNASNQITAATALYGFIAESAQSDRFAATLNRRFKAEGDDAMMIPMNIRDDDFFFTLSNMKRSHLRGAAIGPEYRARAMEILDVADPFCESVGLCDTVIVREGRMHGALLFPGVLASAEPRRVAILGASPAAGAVAKAFKTAEVAMFDPWLETLQSLTQSLTLNVDVNRIAPSMAVDLSGFDLLIDLSALDDLAMITALPPQSLDLRKTASPLKTRCEALSTAYRGYEALLPELTLATYNYLKEQR